MLKIQLSSQKSITFFILKKLFNIVITFHNTTEYYSIIIGEHKGKTTLPTPNI